MNNYNEENIKEAAYYNWMNAGCPSGQDEYFWSMAVKQLSSCECSCKKAKSTCKSASCAKTSAKSCKSKKK